MSRRILPKFKPGPLTRDDADQLNRILDELGVLLGGFTAAPPLNITQDRAGVRLWLDTTPTSTSTTTSGGITVEMVSPPPTFPSTTDLQVKRTGSGWVDAPTSTRLHYDITSGATLIAVLDNTAFTAGQSLVLDSEQLLISSAATTTLNGAINNSTTTVVVATGDGVKFLAHFSVLLIGTEKLHVSAISGDTLTVVRGWLGTTAASHADASAATEVSTYVFTVERGYNGSTAASHTAGAIASLIGTADLSCVTTFAVENVAASTIYQVGPASPTLVFDTSDGFVLTQTSTTLNTDANSSQLSINVASNASFSAGDVARCENEQLLVLAPWVTVLFGDIDNAVTSINVATGTGVLYIANRSVLLTLDAAAEKMLVTAIVGDTLTVTRGYSGTSAAAHNDGVELQECAASMLAVDRGYNGSTAASHVATKLVVKTGSVRVDLDFTVVQPSVGEVDGSPLYTAIGTILFDQSDGFVVSQPGAGQARIDLLPTLVVEDIDSAPSYTAINKIRFDQADGFVITNPSAGIARIDLDLSSSTVTISTLTVTNLTTLTDVYITSNLWIAPSPVTVISSSQNNYNVLVNYTTWVINCTSNSNLTGIDSSTFTSGAILYLVNVGTSTLTLVNNSGSSSAGNQFINTTGANITLTQDQMAMLIWLPTVASGSPGFLVVPLGSGGSSAITVGTTTISGGSSGNILYNNAGAVGELTTTGTGTIAVLSIAPALTGAPSSILTNATTNAADTVWTYGHNSSGTPAAGFGQTSLYTLHSSTTTNQSAYAQTTTWATATHASRKARTTFNIYDTSIRECIRLEASGSAAMLAFFGSSAVVQQTGDLGTAIALYGLMSGTPTFAEVNLTFTDVTTNDVSITKHGFVPKAPNDITKKLDGTGAWSALTVTDLPTVAGTGSSNSAVVGHWEKITKTHTDFQTAATSNKLAIYTAPAGTVVHAVKIKHSVQFAGTGMFGYTVSVGTTSNTTLLAPAFGVIQPTGATVYYLTLVPGTNGVMNSDANAPSHTGSTTIYAEAVSTPTNLNQSTAGSVDIWLYVSVTP